MRARRLRVTRPPGGAAGGDPRRRRRHALRPRGHRIVTQAYLDELEDVRGDHEIVSRSLLDAVLAGGLLAPSSVRDARILGIDLIPQNVVVVARAPVGDDDASARAALRTLRRAKTLLRESVLGSSSPGRALWASRGRVVCLCPAPTPRDAARATEAAHAAAPRSTRSGCRSASALARRRRGGAGAYAEAREAADIAIRTGVRNRALVYDDVLVDHVLRENENAGRVIAAALGPLREYDARRNARLDRHAAGLHRRELQHHSRGARNARPQQHAPLPARPRAQAHRARPRTPRDIVFLALSLRLDEEPATGPPAL